MNTNHTNHTKSNWLTGFLAGGAIGATIAMLTAPRSGEETRTLIREKTMEAREDAVQALEEGRSRLEDYSTEARHRFEDFASETRSRFDDFATETRHRLTGLKSVGSEALSEQKELVEKSAKKAKEAALDPA